MGGKTFNNWEHIETKATFSQTGGRDGRAEGAATEGDFYRKWKLL